MSEDRRRFNTSEHIALYLATDGRCARCGAELEPGWHADHVVPRSKGGPTDLTNGQPLCPKCNAEKGDQVRYQDTFVPRPFQREVIKKVLDGIELGRDTTVVLASPGSGKTLAYQAAATYLFREGLIDYAAIFAPRINLARQCETAWRYRADDGRLHGDHELFDHRSRFGAIRHVPNTPPLIPPGHQGVGFVTTYAALAAQPALFLSWAKAMKGRFLLVADEAQFCGATDERDRGGTRAGALIEQLHDFARHTLLCSGTPYRSDGYPLVLADYEDADDEGLRRLVTHAEATYSDGIAEHYLRRFEATLHQVRVREKSIATDSSREYDLSDDGSELADVLRRPDVWQPIVDGVVRAIREKQQVHPAYRGLISCMEQSDADRAFRYAQTKYPGLRVKLAISNDGTMAEQALRDFRAQPSDLLVTVRKAFIGYDCPEITVVGILSNYRDRGHLMQLSGRGLRIPSKGPLKGLPWSEQSCRIIAPDDPGMQDFIDYLRGELEDGLRERERREAAAAERTEQDTLSYIESAAITQSRAVSNDAELGAEDLLRINIAKQDFGLVDDATRLWQAFAQWAGKPVEDEPDATPPVPPGRTPMTEREEIEQVNRRVADEVKAHLSARGIYPSDPSYSEAIKKATAMVNAAPGSMPARQVRTIDQANARLRAIKQLRAQAAEEYAP